MSVGVALAFESGWSVYGQAIAGWRLAVGSLYFRVMPARPVSAPDPASDEALMCAFAGGDMAAFDVLYGRHRKGLYAFISRLLPARSASVDDIFQDVWMNVARSRASYQPQAQFRTWLFQIARNRSIDLLRERQPVLASELTRIDDDDAPDFFDGLADDSAPQPETVVIMRERAARLEVALAALPAVQREAFLLKEHAELSLEDIAQLTGVRPETAKSRLRYALTKLRAALGGVLE